MPLSAKDFPYEYVSGGYFRKKGTPKGTPAEIIHGESIVDAVLKFAEEQMREQSKPTHCRVLIENTWNMLDNGYGVPCNERLPCPTHNSATFQPKSPLVRAIAEKLGVPVVETKK